MIGISKEIWEKKYKAEEDNTIEDTWRRVANAVASVELTDEVTKSYAEKFYNMLSGFKVLPGGRITAGSGTKHNYLLNCAVLGIKDDLEDIYETIKKAAKMAKCNYGTGFNFSSIRPKNAPLSVGGVASGPVSFMRIFDISGSVIETGGGRRAAAIGILNVDHPDIFDFIDAKREEGTLTQFNLSVGITDKFMQAVIDDTDFDLVFEGKVYNTIRAKDLYNKIIESGFNYNDPGIIFLDTVNKYNNSRYYLGDIIATNPSTQVA